MSIIKSATGSNLPKLPSVEDIEGGWSQFVFFFADRTTTVRSDRLVETDRNQDGDDYSTLVTHPRIDLGNRTLTLKINTCSCY